jgi:hypothetical protein
MLTPVIVPDGVDDARVRRTLLQDFGIKSDGACGRLRIDGTEYRLRSLAGTHCNEQRVAVAGAAASGGGAQWATLLCATE